MTLSKASLLSLPLAVAISSCGGGGDGNTANSNSRNQIPTPSAPSIKDEGTLNYLSYGLWNEPSDGGTRNLRADILSRNAEVSLDISTREFNRNRDVDVTYQDDDGFIGIYSHDGKTGKITSDVTLKLTINSAGAYVNDFGIGVENPIVIEGQNLGRLDGLAGFSEITSKGGFTDNDDLGTFSELLYSSGSIKGAFSNQDTDQGNPNLVAGEIKVRYGDYDNETKNSLVGVFVANPNE